MTDRRDFLRTSFLAASSLALPAGAQETGRPQPAPASPSRGARVVSLTDSIFSPIAPSADVWLEVVEANFEGFRSMAATLALAMTLTVAVAGRRSEKG